MVNLMLVLLIRKVRLIILVKRVRVKLKLTVRRVVVKLNCLIVVRLVAVRWLMLNKVLVNLMLFVLIMVKCNCIRNVLFVLFLLMKKLVMIRVRLILINHVRRMCNLNLLLLLNLSRMIFRWWLIRRFRRLIKIIGNKFLKRLVVYILYFNNLLMFRFVWKNPGS